MNQQQKKLSHNLGTMLVFSFVMFAAFQVAYADETLTETATATGNDAKRGIKKASHRAEEVFCAAGDVTCATRKAGNRIIESKDATVDAAKKLKNKID